MSRSITTSTPWFLKWTVTAANAYFLEMTMHQLQSSVPLCVLAVVEGEFMMQNLYVMVLTCNIFAMHL
jgi:hypothetical protein